MRVVFAMSNREDVWMFIQQGRAVGQEAKTGALVSAMSYREDVRRYFEWHGEFRAADWCAVERRAAV